MTLTVGSLFTGIGGLDLGLERSGMTGRWHSEIDPYASRVLAKHWPDVPNLGDITTIEWSTVQHVDLVCGGYPCQPFSLAGGRRGESDPRHLWPYFASALRELRPRWALLENVPGHLSMGFGRVLGDLAELGFDAEWQCIPAAAVGAPHLRYRIFVVAYSDRGELRDEPISVTGCGGAAIPGDDGPPVADAPRCGRDERRDGDRQESWRGLFKARRTGRLLDGGHWSAEPDVGRVAHGVPSRVDRLRCLGNSVVPQVAEWIGRRIMEVAAASEGDGQ